MGVALSQYLCDRCLKTINIIAALFPETRCPLDRGVFCMLRKERVDHDRQGTLSVLEFLQDCQSAHIRHVQV